MRQLLFILFISISANCHSQMVDDYEEKFLQRVKQLDEFLDRFNEHENGKVKVSESSDYNHQRVKSILKLFDTEIVYKHELVKEFVTLVTNRVKPVKLDFYDKNWYAQVTCLVNVEGKDHQLILTLENQGNREEGSKWVIIGAMAEFLKIHQAPRDSTRIIHPMSHEEDFITLSRVFEDGKHLAEYSNLGKGYKPDPMTILYYLMSNSKIEFKNTLDITYHFLQVPGWAFKVNFSNRLKENSGWLISELNRLKQADLLHYKREVLAIKD